MTRFAPVYRALGLILMLFGLALLAPLGVSHLTSDGAERVYEHVFLLTVLCGTFLWYRYRHTTRDLSVRDGFLLVVLVWTVLPAFSALPFMIHLGMSHTDAYFEATSALTATGATLMSGLDDLPKSINLWRHLMQWLGGMGLIVLVVAILPMLGIGGRQMLAAEIPGPMKENRLTPRVTETAKGLWLIYVVMTIACTLAYRWAGMSWFDAVCHSFSTVSLGGFSTHDASLGYFQSASIEWICVGFMLFSGINYATHFLALSGRSLFAYGRDPEAGWFVGVLLVSVFVLANYLWKEGTFEDMDSAFRYALFNVISVATTTGYSTIDYGQWPMFVGLWMLFLCSFSTSAGSTGGGIKMMRALLLYKQVYRELVRAMHPAAVYNVRLGGATAPQSVLFAVLAFAFVYMVSIVTMTLLLAFTGLDIVTAFSAVAASINNTGPGLGQVGPASTYAVLEDFQTWICTFAMLLGRLEIFTLLVVLTPAFWRK
ncbi:trk system potassium uptake protein TrkH [Azonexus fungiphilus]|uniref:Trk system potassium uptake protein n=1 Tax=Azonexus fungiphilus TaxID=146940 RepID=A0A495VNX7_9RHOO|nr:potassium transporter TrkG [Azonexus fungiphilus]NHC06683.1 TrkH family potassium uptake protein [Azonexus fungiphilus]RKT51111.1 trk system potassium uptake protein TrkH [Azonexus fungiphilus]